MPSSSSAVTRLRPFWPYLKWGFFVLLVVFIGRRAFQLWKSAPVEEIHVDLAWLALAGVAYFCGWLPSAFFWLMLMRRMKQPVRAWDAVRAYYAGHVGKYVPGKALVLVIRGAILKDSGANPILAGVTAGYETLVFMATGSAWSLALAPQVFPHLLSSWTGLQVSMSDSSGAIFAAGVFLLTFLSTPFSAWLFTRLGRKTLQNDGSNPTDPQPAISAGLISLGVVVCSIGWFCHALSLGMVLRSLSTTPLEISEFPTWLAACALSTVGGFVILLAPGGLGVREGLLIEVLKDQPDIGPGIAVVAAGLLRSVWFVTELLAAAGFYLAGARRR